MINQQVFKYNYKMQLQKIIEKMKNDDKRKERVELQYKSIKNFSLDKDDEDDKNDIYARDIDGNKAYVFIKLKKLEKTIFLVLTRMNTFHIQYLNSSLNPYQLILNQR